MIAGAGGAIRNAGIFSPPLLLVLLLRVLLIKSVSLDVHLLNSQNYRYRNRKKDKKYAKIHFLFLKDHFKPA